MQKELNIKTTDKKIIYGTLNTPKEKSEGLIIFVHGLTSSQDEPIINHGSKYFAKKGYTTYTFNFYGDEKTARTLQSSSLKQHITDANNVIDHFDKAGYKNIFLIGHSLGGLTILYSRLSKISGIILWDASIGGKELLGDVTYDKKIKSHIIDRGDGYKHIIGKAMYDDFCIPSRQHIERIHTIKIPIQIICAEKGLKAPGKKYYQAANEPKEYSIITGASHCFEERGTKEELFEKTYKRIKRFSK